MIPVQVLGKALAIFAILASLASAQDKGALNQASPNSTASAEPQTILQRAADSIDLASEGQIFKISGTAELVGSESINAHGTWVMLVAPKEKTYIDIAFPDYRGRIWTQDQIAWHQESTKPTSFQLRQFEALLRIRERLLAAYPQAKYKTSEQTMDKVKRTCVAVSQKEGTIKLCADATSGVPLLFNQRGAIYKFSDYQKVANRQFPLNLQVNGEKGDPIAAAAVRTIEIASAEDAKLLTPPADLSPVAGLKCIAGTWDQHVRRSSSPEFPPLAKMARVQGNVFLAYHINEQGRVENVQFLRGHPMLAQSAVNALKEWQFDPFVCDGKATGVDEFFTVNFNLTGGAPEMR